MNPPLLTVHDAVSWLRERGVRSSANVIYAAVRASEFPCVRLGRRILVPVSQLEKWSRGEWRPDGDAEPERPKRRPLRVVWR